jgi:hypothetical protein
MSSTDVKNPHDALVSDNFSQLEHARSLLEALILKSINCHFDFDTLKLLLKHARDGDMEEISYGIAV